MSGHNAGYHTGQSGRRLLAPHHSADCLHPEEKVSGQFDCQHLWSVRTQVYRIRNKLLFLFLLILICRVREGGGS